MMYPSRPRIIFSLYWIRKIIAPKRQRSTGVNRCPYIFTYGLNRVPHPSANNGGLGRSYSRIQSYYKTLSYSAVFTVLVESLRAKYSLRSDITPKAVANQLSTLKQNSQPFDDFLAIYGDTRDKVATVAWSQYTTEVHLIEMVVAGLVPELCKYYIIGVKDWRSKSLNQ